MCAILPSPIVIIGALKRAGMVWISEPGWGLIEDELLIKAAEASIVLNRRMGKMDKLIKPLLEILAKEPMTPHQLAAKLEKNVGIIVTTLRFMSYEKWVRQDETTKTLSLTPLGRAYLRNLKPRFSG